MVSILRMMAPDSPAATLSEEEVVEELVRLYLHGLRSRPEEWDAR